MSEGWPGFDSTSKHEKAIKELQSYVYKDKHDIDQLKQTQINYDEELKHFETCFDYLTDRIRNAENQINICYRNCIILVILTFISYSLPHIVNLF